MNSESEPRPARCPLCGSDRQRFERTVKGFRIERCLDCKMVFANPRPSAEALEKIYKARPNVSALVAYYAKRATPALMAQYDEILARIERALGTTGTLLDLGCGAGYFVERANLRGWRSYGVDMGEWIEEAVGARNLHNIFIGELEQAGFRPSSFDAVSAMQVLEHLVTPGKTVKSLFNLLRPGGILYVDVPNYHTPTILLGADDWYMNHPPQHINFFSPRTLRGLLEEAGFEVLDVYSEGGIKFHNLTRWRGSTDSTGPAANRGSEAPSETRVEGPSQETGTTREQGWKSALKMLVNRRLRLGINLAAVARRPADIRDQGRS